MDKNNKNNKNNKNIKTGKNNVATVDNSDLGDSSQNLPAVETNLLKKLGLNNVNEIYELLNNIKDKELEYTNLLELCEDENKRANLETRLNKVITAKNTLIKEMKKANLPEVIDNPKEINPTLETPAVLDEKTKKKNKKKKNIKIFVDKYKKSFYITMVCVPVGFIIFLLASDNRSTAELNQIGYGYYLQENYDKAIKYLEKSMKKGDYTQISLMGDIYFYGTSNNLNTSNSNFSIDYDNALKCYTMSANNNDDMTQSYSQYQLAIMYHNGLGVEKDLARAVELYELSADNGYVESAKIVADMYYIGDEIDKNSSKALYYYQKCNSIDMYITQYYIGNIYFAGSGTEQDYVQALNWYKKASNNNITEASYMVGYMYEYGLGTEIKYDSAITYYTRGVEANHIQSMFNLANLYENTLEEYELAFELYKQSADLGYVESMYKVSDMYANGIGVVRNSIKSEEYLELAEQKE
ncbi:MAG: tetratricopeptide repeat protein [bacterium]